MNRQASDRFKGCFHEGAALRFLSGIATSASIAATLSYKNARPKPIDLADKNRSFHQASSFRHVILSVRSALSGPSDRTADGLLFIKLHDNMLRTAYSHYGGKRSRVARARLRPSHRTATGDDVRLQQCPQHVSSAPITKRLLYQTSPI